MKNNNPLVSIIVCTKSRIGTLKAALESIFNQSVQNFEVIVVLSSRSEDNSNDFLVDMKGKDMIRLVINDGNRINARNLGISLAKGQFICFVDDDDIILRNKIEVQANYLINHEDVDVVSCTTMIDAGSAIANTLVEHFPLDIVKILESGEDVDTVINFQSCMFRKRVFDNFYKDKQPFDNLFIAGGEGQFLIYDMIINHGVHFANTPNTIYVYHVGAAPNSLSGNVDPVFYNTHLYGKSWDEKREFVKNFQVLFGDKEEKIEEKTVEEPTKKPRKPRAKKEKPSEESTEKPKRGRKKKVEQPAEIPTEKPKRGRKKKTND